MTMEWKEILSAIDADKDLSKDNVIEKIKPRYPFSQWRQLKSPH